ncbi:unnamed protein product, partial [Cyprideis torosa]
MPKKVSKTCGTCGAKGHNARSCNRPTREVSLEEFIPPAAVEKPKSPEEQREKEQNVVDDFPPLTRDFANPANPILSPDRISTS